jgi:hypothetical protein
MEMREATRTPSAYSSRRVTPPVWDASAFTGFGALTCVWYPFGGETTSTRRLPPGRGFGLPGKEQAEITIISIKNLTVIVSAADNFGNLLEFRLFMETSINMTIRSAELYDLVMAILTHPDAININQKDDSPHNLCIS